MITGETNTDHADAHQMLVLNAQMLATATVLRMASQIGAEIRERPVWHGAEMTMRYAEPVEGLRVARALEAAAVHVVRDYIRYARRDGQSWLEIGVILEVSSNAAERGIAVPEAAFEYATGTHREERWTHDQVIFTWTCSACRKVISDLGPYESHPGNSEHGHASGCTRLAAAVADWSARPWED